MIQARAKERQIRKPINSVVQKSAPQNKARDELAKIAGVSHDTIEKAFIVFTKYIWWRNFSLLNQISFFAVLTK